MAKSSKDYWREREEENLKRYLLEEEEYTKRLHEILNYTADQIQLQINGFYSKYADKEGITMAEAKRRVKQLDIDEYARKAKKYVAEKNFSKQANDEMRLYNATMKINRLELLKANIGLELTAGYDDLQKELEKDLTQRTLEELKRQAGILGEALLDNEKTANAIVNASFRNATFSDRIWMYQGMVRSELDKLLQQGLIQGQHPDQLATHLYRLFGVSRYNAERLMRTEMARVQIEAQKQSFERNGYEEYIFLALGTACDVCKGLNEQHFKVKDMMPGENAPPMHPNCRCSTAAYMDKDHESGYYLSGIKRIGSNAVDLNYIESDDFSRKFSRITKDSAVNDSLRRYSKAMLTHRKDTDGEDLYIIGNGGKLLLRKLSSASDLEVTLTKEETETIRNMTGLVIGMHNHPTNIPPTGSDFAVAGFRKYDFGIVITHNGKVYKYEVGSKPFLPRILDARIDKYTNAPYNQSVEEAHLKALDEMVKEYGIKWQEL